MGEFIKLVVTVLQTTVNSDFDLFAEGEFMVIFLLVFTALVSAVISDVDYLSMARIAFGLDFFPSQSLLIPIDG